MERTGATLLAETTAQNLGVDAPETLLKAMEMAGCGLLTAVGISATIFRARGAAGARQAYRHFAFTVLQPMGKHWRKNTG